MQADKLPPLPEWCLDDERAAYVLAGMSGPQYRNDMQDYARAALSAHGQPEPNGKLVGWWNGISRHDDRDGTGPSVRWGEGAENTYHDIPLYDGYNPIHYVTPPAHGQPVVDGRMARGWRNRFISAQTELNQRANGNDYELARAYAEATANEYEEALIAAIGGNDHG